MGLTEGKTKGGMQPCDNSSAPAPGPPPAPTPKREGYLIFETSDGDELHAYLIQDETLFKRLCSDEVKDNDDALTIWSAWAEEHCDELYDKTKGAQYSAQAPGDYEWPFNDVKVLGTYYIMVY